MEKQNVADLLDRMSTGDKVKALYLFIIILTALAGDGMIMFVLIFAGGIFASLAYAIASRPMSPLQAEACALASKRQDVIVRSLMIERARRDIRAAARAAKNSDI